MANPRHPQEGGSSSCSFKVVMGTKLRFPCKKAPCFSPENSSLVASSFVFSTFLECSFLQHSMSPSCCSHSSLPQIQFLDDGVHWVSGEWLYVCRVLL